MAEPEPVAPAEVSESHHARVSGTFVLYADPSVTAQHVELDPATATERVVEVLAAGLEWSRVRTVLPRQALGLGLDASMGLAVLELEGWVKTAGLLALEPGSSSVARPSSASAANPPGPTDSAPVSFRVRGGTTLRWPDGRVAGQAAADHYFFTPATSRQSESPDGTLDLRCHQHRVAPALGVVQGWLCVSAGDQGEPAATELGVALDVAPRFTTADPGAGVKGALDRDIIRRIVRAHIGDIRACYNDGLAVDPLLAGRVSINFVITGDGTVSSAVVADDSLPDPAVGRCIAGAVATWAFPKPRGGGNVVVTYPFNLTPS